MVVYIEDPNFYNKYSVSLGIQQFANKLGHTCLKLNLNDMFPYTEEYTVLILEGFLFRESNAIINQCESNLDNIKKFFPNSHIIMLGSYSNHCIDFIEYNHPSKVDLHLDTSYMVSEAYKSRGIQSDMYIWSGTQEVYDLAKSYTERNPNINKSREAICMACCDMNPRSDQKFYERAKLFNGLINNGYYVGFNLNKFNFDEIFYEYAISHTSIGTTTPSSDSYRNGKGFRDWIAPFLNCPLIHDDYDGYLELYDGIVPIYEYSNIDDCISKIEYVKSLNEYDRNSLLIKQMEFAELNTIENQLYRAYKKYILSEKNIEVLEKLK